MFVNISTSKRTVHHNELTCRSVPVFFVTYMSHNTSKQHMNFMFVTKLTHLSWKWWLKYSYRLLQQVNNKGKPTKERKLIHLDKRLETVCFLGITLRVWKSKETGNNLERTPLLVGEKRLLLRNLPDHFDKFLPPQRVPTVKKLWMVSKHDVTCYMSVFHVLGWRAHNT